MDTQKKLRFRIITGYNPKDYIAITEDDLEKAKYSMISGGVYNHGVHTIKGSEIKEIREDFRYYTGWFDTYEPKEGEDMAQIRRDMPPMPLFTARAELANQRVTYVLRSGKLALLDTPLQIDVLLLNAKNS